MAAFRDGDPAGDVTVLAGIEGLPVQTDEGGRRWDELARLNALS
jgi:hypothetical protein